VLSKIVICAVAVILSAPIYAAPGGGSAGGSSGSHGGSGGGGGGSHSGGGGGFAGHGAGGVGRGGGLSGRAAAATARGSAYGHDVSKNAVTDAMHATHMAGDKHSEVEHTSLKTPGMDGGAHRYRREPGYSGRGYPTTYFPTCMPGADRNNSSWFDCYGPTKSSAGHK